MESAGCWLVSDFNQKNVTDHERQVSLWWTGKVWTIENLDNLEKDEIKCFYLFVLSVWLLLSLSVKKLKIL